MSGLIKNGNSADKLRMPKSAAYSAAEIQQLNKQQILGMRSLSPLLPRTLSRKIWVTVQISSTTRDLMLIQHKFY